MFIIIVTTMQALEDGATTKTLCKALGLTTPWRGDCLSHAVNGAMNRACTSLVAEKKKSKARARVFEEGEEENMDMDVDEAGAEGGSQSNGAFVVKSNDEHRPMKAIMGKMQTCITWTKKSSVGWKAMTQAAKV